MTFRHSYILSGRARPTWLNSIATTNEQKLDARLAEFRSMLAFE